MKPSKPKFRVAVVSPFLDKRHGSERIITEWISHLPDEFEIHIYSQRVEDFDPLRFTLHRIPELPGPHLFNFLWWLVANRLWRYWDGRFRGFRYDLVFSSGANCLDADVICVHIVFAEYVRQVSSANTLARNTVWDWPRLLHRKLYYAISLAMEQRAYENEATALIVYSCKSAEELKRFFGRTEQIPVLHLGLDHRVFNTDVRAALREKARKVLEIPEDRFVLILVGNDWRNKGVPTLLSALAELQQLPIGLLLVTREESSACQRMVMEKNLESRVTFLPPRQDVEFYYAAADAYVGPSLQDSYGIPPAEAMACGLPVIVSAAAGVSEIVTDGVDGMILEEPSDARKLAAMIRHLYNDKIFRDQLGIKAAETARKYNWERNGQGLSKIFEEALRRKPPAGAQTVAQEL